jgi:hypothetical protein
MSIVLAEFGKFPFKHFAWKQLLLYYNHVSMLTKAHYAYCGKEILSKICEKMATQESALRGGRFFAFGSIAVGNDTLACSGPCTICRACSTVVGNSS